MKNECVEEVKKWLKESDSCVWEGHIDSIVDEIAKDYLIIKKKNLKALAESLFKLRYDCFKDVDLFHKFGGQLDMIDLLLFDKKLLTYGLSSLESDDDLKNRLRDGRLLGQNSSDDKDKKTISE